MRPLIGITGRKDTSARLLNVPMCAVGETYIRAIHHVGGTPVIVPPVVVDGDWETLVQHLDGLLLSGGGDIDPSYYGEFWRDGHSSVNHFSKVYILAANNGNVCASKVFKR